jgi:tetratricopeptide (TPR) repeat protein
LALIAWRQHERGDPTAKATLLRALEAAQDVITPEDSYWAFLHVARVQGMFGDRTGSVKSFQKAFRAAEGRGTELYPLPNKLLWLAKAQAVSGDISASLKTFEEAIQLSHALKEPGARVVHLQCAAWAQTAVGLAKAASLTFKKALEEAEAIAPENRWDALSEVGRWQLKAGDDQGAVETVQYLFRKAENLPDSAQKITAFGTVRTLAVRAGNWKLATDLLVTISDDWEKAGALQFISESLVRTKDPYGTQYVLTQLSESASAILKNPPPKERSKVDTMRSSIAVVQAAGGNISGALETADTIRNQSTRIRTYGRVANLLTAKGDLSGAQQTISAMEEEWLSFHSSEDVVRKLAKAKAKAGDETGALAWGRKQKSDYARANALLGVADGFLGRYGIEDIEHLVPATPMRDVCSLRPSEPL